MAISDGIGGGSYGRAISRLACTTGLAALDEGASPHDAFLQARDEVRFFLRESRAKRSGATLVLARIDNGLLSIAWQGDTSCFILRNGRLEEVTATDNVPGTNRLSLYVGQEGRREPHCVLIPIRENDAIFFFTDGVPPSCVSAAIMDNLIDGRCAQVMAEDVAQNAAQKSLDDVTVLVAVPSTTQRISHNDTEGKPCLQMP
ncbi:MAG: SpoIIE family protein phosphatase [Olsenella sp.]|nr:SpoIIE family protein phosphatase [Olsenella sp.]